MDEPVRNIFDTAAHSAQKDIFQKHQTEIKSFYCVDHLNTQLDNSKFSNYQIASTKNYSTIHKCDLCDEEAAVMLWL